MLTRRGILIGAGAVVTSAFVEKGDRIFFEQRVNR